MATQLQEDFEGPADTPAEIDDEGQSDPEPSEDRARALGWKPKDEYKGDRPWRDWQDFLNEDLSNAPQLKATVKLLKRRLDQADKRQKRLESTIKEATEYFSKAEQRAYDRAVSDLRAKQRAAVAVADEDAFDAAEEELKALNKDMKPKAPQIDPGVQKVFRKWERDNDWYGNDEAMTAYADRMANKMGSYADNDMDPEEYLEELSARVKKEFAHKFELPKKRSAVEGVAETRPTKGQKTYDNLPPEAKAQCDRFIAQGILKDKAAYLKSYSWD